jgi:hypothetical protein
VVLALLDPEQDAGAGFRLTGRAAHDDACAADLDNTQLAGGDIVAIETAPCPYAPASVQAAVGIAHIEVRQWREEFDQPIPGPEAEWKALVERGADDPLRMGEQRGGHGLVSGQTHRVLLRCRAGHDVEEPHGLSGHAGNLKHAPGSTGEHHRNGGRKSA